MNPNDIIAANQIAETQLSKANGYCALRTATVFELSIEDRQTLRQWIKSTGGLLVGSACVYSDNTGAMGL